MDDKYTAVYLSDAIERITDWLCEEEWRKNIQPNRKLNRFLATDMLAKCPRIAKRTEPQGREGRVMTMQGVIAKLQNLLADVDVPFYDKGGIKKVIETIQMQMGLADRKIENCSEKPNNCEDDEYLEHLFIEVVKGHMSDAEANQAWYEYINHKTEPNISKMETVDEPQTERSDE